MTCDRLTRDARKRQSVVVAIRASLSALILFGMLAIAGCIGTPTIGFRQIDQYGAALEHERRMSVGCLEVEPRLVVHGGLVYEPALIVLFRNPERSGDTAKVAIDSLRLQSRRFDIRPIVVQVPGGASQNALVLQPGESARIVLEYIGEWPDGYNYKNIPADERIVMHIAGVECGGESVPARSLYYEVKH